MGRVLWWNGKTGLAFFGGVHALLTKPPKVPGIAFAELDYTIGYESQPDVMLIRDFAERFQPMSRAEIEAVNALLEDWAGGSIDKLCGG